MAYATSLPHFMPRRYSRPFAARLRLYRVLQGLDERLASGGDEPAQGGLNSFSKGGGPGIAQGLFYPFRSPAPQLKQGE